MNTPFQPGDRVYWWKRITREVECPYAAEVLAITAKRIKIAVTDPYDDTTRVVRYVAPETIHVVEKYFCKAIEQGPLIPSPVSSWGQLTIYLEVGEDLYTRRSVDVFENGNMLSYDREHWVDDFYMLGDAQINRNRRVGTWGESAEIEPAEFEEVWREARQSETWGLQQASENMSRLGVVPVWLREPRRRSPRLWR